ncbi:hypothetical protein [Tepidibacter aestuarii]|uniref:hypothetical protein n=1 Tax=Tepidibacter aestuarii TaxID=2925782 RepID=UPI0020BFD563|nr:hypothetical protein [Tepidibacter aestuarii]CAH2213252.1 conserved membrane protein of unknown function [Tepidibacter aestuarii]
MTKKKKVSFNKIDKVVMKLPYTLFLAIYSIYYLDIDKLKKYVDYSEETIKRIVILFAYMLSNYISTKDIKNHKDIKMIYLFNFIVFLIILVIS